MFRFYVADSLFYSPQNMRLTEKLSDMFKKSNKSEPEKSGDEVVEEIMKKHGLTFERG